MFKQDDPLFPDDVRRAGCNFLSLLAMCELVAGDQFTKEQVLMLYGQGISTKFVDWKGNMRTWIEKNCSVVNPDAIASAALILLKSKKRIRQVGAIDKNGKPTFWAWANREPYNDPQYILLEFPTGGKFGGHYVLTDAMRIVLFDSAAHDYTDRPIKGGLLYKVL